MNFTPEQLDETIEFHEMMERTPRELRHTIDHHEALDIAGSARIIAACFRALARKRTILRQLGVPVIRVFTAEFMSERKAVVRGFTEKSEAEKWARERVADDNIAAIALWEMRAPDARKALAVAAEGKQWYTERTCWLVVARKAVRVSK